MRRINLVFTTLIFTALFFLSGAVIAVEAPAVRVQPQPPLKAQPQARAAQPQAAPPLEMPFKMETEHYRILTDTTERGCKSAASAMEQLYKVFGQIFKPEKKERPKVEVVIFQAQSSFADYIKSSGMKAPASAIGLFRQFSDGKGQILTFRRETEEFHTLSTLYHEGTHQFVGMVMNLKDPPLWMNEGLAVYFENSKFEDGVFNIGIIPRERLIFLQKAVQSGKYIPLADLFERKRDTFDTLCYSESWAVVYFFLNAEGGMYQERFIKYFRELRAGKDPQASLNILTTDMKKFEDAWVKYFSELAIPEK